MDHKDFKKIIKDKIKNAFSIVQSTYVAKQRQSRPRVKKNILQTKEDNHCVVHDDKDYT